MSTQTPVKPVADLIVPSIDPDKLMFQGIEVGEPWFSVSDVAKVFFARSPHWIRWREERGFFTLNGKAIATTRTEPKSKKDPGQRRYNLKDIEQMAHALAQKGAISTPQLLLALHIVRLEGKLWEYL